MLEVFKFDWAEDKQDMELHKQVKRFWALESHKYIFRNNADSLNSIEDERALQILKRATRLKDGRYEVDLLWRNNNPETGRPCTIRGPGNELERTGKVCSTGN